MKIDIYVDSSSPNGKNTEISFDGHMLDGVVSFDMRWEVNKPGVLRLEIAADDITMHNTAIQSSGFRQVFITKP